MKFETVVCENCVHSDVCKLKESITKIEAYIKDAVYKDWPLESWLNDIEDDIALSISCNQKMINTGILR